MRVSFEPGRNEVKKSTEIYYHPINWHLCMLDSRIIVNTFHEVFKTEYSVHVDDGKSEYMTTYQSIHDFLLKADFEETTLYDVSFAIPVDGNGYVITINLKDDYIKIWTKDHTCEEAYCFDPVITRVSQKLSQSNPEDQHGFLKQNKNTIINMRNKSVIKFTFDTKLTEKHDMIALSIFDATFHLGTIYADAWDHEWHFWRKFEGYKQYQDEAPNGDFYESLAELSFDLFISNVKYRISLMFCSVDESIKIEYDGTNEPFDFVPIMEKL